MRLPQWFTPKTNQNPMRSDQANCPDTAAQSTKGEALSTPSPSSPGRQTGVCGPETGGAAGAMGQQAPKRVRGVGMLGRAADRRGVVLILALGMLTLFTIVAITLAAISKSEATAASNFKRLEQFGTLKIDVAPDEVDDLFRFAMNQLIYDTRNAQSAARGHSLLRDMYGSPEKYTLSSGTPPITLNNEGGELRWRKADENAIRLATGNNNFTVDDYQGAYNGTGIFLPKKVDLTVFAGGPPTSLTLGSERLSPAEIALQTAFLHVPSGLGPLAGTQISLLPAQWAKLFGPYQVSPPNSFPNPGTSNIRFWYPRFPINFTVFDAYTAPNLAPALGRDATRPYPTGRQIEPELYFSSQATLFPAPQNEIGYHWFGFDEDYDYPDINNMFLAMERADGTILIPSFHRPGLLTQVSQGVVNILGISPTPPSGMTANEFVQKMPWMSSSALAAGGVPPNLMSSSTLRGMVLRPRAADFNAASLGIQNTQAGPFRELADITDPNNTGNLDFLPDDIDQSGFIGDSPMELDVDTDGDGLRDAIWIDLGHPVVTVGNQSFKPLYAFKVIDMDSKLNLNVHGNLYRVPGAGSTSYPLMHSSSYGASPAEVNPMYGLILGDQADPTKPANAPHWPVWGFADTAIPPMFPASHPYKRLLEGDATVVSAGRWSSPSLSTTTFPRPGQSTQPTTAMDDDNLSVNFDYSEGNANPVHTAGVNALPAVQGRYSPAEFLGIGRRFHTLSQTAETNATQFGLVNGEGDFLPALLNHAETSANILGARLDAQQTGSNSAAIQPGGLSRANLTMDEATEFNAHAAIQDSPFTVQELLGLWRAGDIDTSIQNNRLGLLNPSQFHHQTPTTHPTPPPSALPAYYSREAFAQQRMRRMFTHASWDLSRYNAPPITAFGTLLQPSHFSDEAAFFQLAIGTTNPPPKSPLAVLARQHVGGMGTSGRLNGLAGLASLLGISLSANMITTLSDPAIRTADGLDTLIPQEVLRGRRFDLNRPLTSYTDASGIGSANTQLIDLERESFAQQIYVLLYLSSGAFGKDFGNTGLMPADLRLAQARTLAQLAVNIVDSIDPDSVMTIMRFDPDLFDGWQPPTTGNPPTVDGVAMSGSTLGETNTVIGFELPELVINEGVSVVVEEYRGDDPNTPAQDGERYEISFAWCELANPWPNYRDPIDNQDGVLLYDTTKAKPIWMVGIRNQHESWFSADGAPPTQPTRFVTFEGGADASIPPATAQQRVLSRTSANGGYYLVGPDSPNGVVQRTVQLLDPADWQVPVSPNNGFNDYTATDFRTEMQIAPNAYKPIEVEFKLYRLRNPLRDWDNLENPYIAMDFLKTQVTDRTVQSLYWERDVNGTLTPSSGAPKAPTKIQAGAYYEADPASQQPVTPPPPVTNPTERYSLQRKQPWHGYNSEWTPYGRDTNHPLYENYLNQGAAYLEGLFLGLPSLADNGLIGADDPTFASAVNPHAQENAMRESGFAPVTNGTRPCTFNPASRKNENALTHWLTFPFLNRQLASPLELMHVRLYGSHVWMVGNEATFNNGAGSTGGSIPEWRLRFTDDFEFAVHAWEQSAGSGTPKDQPYYERVWRSRQAPWYLDNRLGHPNWGPLGVTDLTNINVVGAKIAASAGPQFMSPFPHLYRFFEFVECRSRFYNGAKSAEQWDFASGPLPKTKRTDRVPGKVQLNTITEEEVFKGLVDTFGAMYVDPTEASGFLSGSGTLTVSAGYWPTNYLDSLISPMGECPFGASNPLDIASRAIPWISLVNSTNIRTAPGTPSPTTGNSVLLYSGFHVLTQTLWSQPDPTALSLSVLQLNQRFSPHRQWPGIILGPDISGNHSYPGTDPNFQVSSELFRTFLFSRNGPDGIAGTGDDKPFRSFGADDVSDTILRPRNFSFMDFIHGGAIDMTLLSSPPSSPDDGRLFQVLEALGGLYFDGADDIVTVNIGGTNLNLGLGDYLVRLGGQVTPRLFDPVADPYIENERFTLASVGARTNLGSRIPPLVNDSSSELPMDYWMLDGRRNEIVSKIANNSTTRSHVFAVWVTVGLFKVEPGTENLKVPLLGSEVGAENGRPVRHRAFFVVDRSQAKSYEPEDIDANYELPQMMNKKVLEYYKIME